MNKSYQNFKKRTGKLAVALTLAGATVVGGMAIGADAATYTNGYTSTSVKLKAGTSTSSSVLTTIKANQQVRVLGTSGNLLKVSYNGKTGYVAKTAIKNQYKITDCSYEVTTKKALTVRKGPGSAFVSAGRLAGDETVSVEGKTNNGWYLITYKGKAAYIPSGSNYVKYTIDYTVKDCSYKVKTKKDLAVRQLAGQGYLSPGRLAADTTVTVKGKTSNGWYLIDFNGRTAYIPSGSNYVYRVENNVVGNSAPKINAKDTYSVVKGKTFSPKDFNITAYDNEDGDLTHKIVYSIGTINTSNTNATEITFTASVTDSDNNTVTKTIKVNIKENGAPQIVFAKNVNDGTDITTITVNKGEKLTASEVIKKLGVTVKDEDEDIPASKINVYMSNVDFDTPGYYPIKLSVTDSDGKSSGLVDAYIQVNDLATLQIGFNPVSDPLLGFRDHLDGKILNIGKLSEFNWDKLESMIQPTVSYGGYPVSVDIKYSGAVDTSKVGTYKVKLEATAYGQTDTKYIYVNVNENTAPSIKTYNLTNGMYLQDGDYVYVESTNTLTVKLGTTVDEALLSHFIKVEDERDGDIPFTQWTVSNVDTSSTGTRKVTITVEDSYGVKSTKPIIVKVVETLN